MAAGTGELAGSGPRVARLYHGLLAGCALAAWASLAVQVHLLIGSRGLLPIAPVVASFAEVEQTVWTRFPSFLLWGASDAAITAGVAAGIALSVLALCGVWPRVCFLLSAPLYLGYSVAGREFLSFQWDNLLIECLVLATFLPRDRSAPGAHWLQRLLLFKLYFESGIAKAQSHLGDWFDGSAMTFYYETAPLPAWPAWWLHHLPEAWHWIESWGALSLELFGALLILGPRRARLAALVAFTGFQLLNLATANYGFFVYLALALHVFLLDDTDVARLRAWLRLPRARRFEGIVRVLRRVTLPRALRPFTRATAGTLIGLWIAASVVTGIAHFAPSPAIAEPAADWMRVWRPFRVANAYHLFGHITRERIEPELQAREDGAWRALDLPFKPGDPERPPPFVAPHQPRVDFRLWFYGLDFRRGAPQYVVTLLDRICHDPAAVASLFTDPPPAAPAAVRIAFWQYHFTTPEERAASGAWWRRELLGTSGAMACDAGARDDARRR